MEQREKYRLKINTYKKALAGFGRTRKIDLSGLSEEINEAVKNGRIQKFEYCIELTWKMVKIYLYTFHNIEAKSPNQSMKEFFLINSISQLEYETLMEMLDDRNKLSHEYVEEYFEQIHDKLDEYFNIMKKVYEILSKEAES